jgi:glycosyltransferase involved in cell wall biosynthesis
MFVGVPCVTTDAGAIGEVAIGDHTALVVAKENAVALGAAIDRLLGDADLGMRLAAAARARVAARFSLAAMLDRMEAVYKRAIAARPR